jgi:hypothetical protein
MKFETIKYKNKREKTLKAWAYKTNKYILIFKPPEAATISNYLISFFPATGLLQLNLN